MILLSNHVIPEIVEQFRFLEYVIQNIDTVQSRNSAKKFIKSGELLLDGQIVETGRFVKSGQLIEHFQSEQVPQKIYEIKVPVIYEDNYLAVVHKPAGLSVSGNYFRTLQNTLPFNLKKTVEPDAMKFPRPVHRLDNQTTGMVVVAKTQSAAIELGKQFELNKINKTYVAIVLGLTKNKGTINTPIQGKEARSAFELISSVKSKRYQNLSLVELKLFTGRTHQLRIHLSGIGHPILGDKLYTLPEMLYKGKGLFLCANKIEFMHPKTKQVMDFQIDIPPKFNSFLKREALRTDEREV